MGPALGTEYFFQEKNHLWVIQAALGAVEMGQQEIGVRWSIQRSAWWNISDDLMANAAVGAPVDLGWHKS